MSYQLHNFEAGDVLYASQLNEMDNELKFLDEEAAGLGITGASVGQYAKVKTVDGSGKPLTWETGTPSGGSGLSSEAAELLITILRAGVYTSDVSEDIDDLAADLGVITIVQDGTTLIISGVPAVSTITQTGTTLALI